MRKYYFSLILLHLFFACSTRTNKPEKADEKPLISKNHFPNVIKVEQYGDSVRLEVEKRGDTLIKHFIDLKGLSDDNFDNSYNVACNYKALINNTGLNSNFFYNHGNYQIFFNDKSIVSYCDSVIKNLESNDYNNEVIKPRYNDLKNLVLNNKNNSNYKLDELIANLDFKIVNKKKQTLPKSVLIELYETEFSGGKNFYVIENKGDTTYWFHHLGYMR